MKIATLSLNVLLAALCVFNFSARQATAQIPTIALEPISQNEIVAPVGIANAGDGSDRLFILDQRGKIHIHHNGALLPDPLIDLGSKLVPERENFDERGLLGLAFHPNFGQAGQTGADKFYVYYSAPQPNGDPDDPVNPVDHQSVVAEYAVDSIGANTASLASERILMTFDQPQFNHDGGFLGFSPNDGMLYITTGDGGGGGDNEPGHTGGGDGDPDGGLGNSQDRSNLLGKVLRIDVDGTNGPGGQYGIPGDNPFIGEAGVREEIYAYGLRNPWRASFDRDNGRLFVADVGQGRVEEVNIIEPGGNYGWRVKEGTFDFDATAPSQGGPLLDPIGQYSRPGENTGLPEIGISVTGGVIYRGDDHPALQGVYLFGDWSTDFRSSDGTLLGLRETAPGAFELSVLDVLGGNPIGEYIQAFGEDQDGEVYVATKSTLAPSALDPSSGLPTGAIYRIVPEPATAGLAVLAGILLVGRSSRRRTPV